MRKALFLIVAANAVLAGCATSTGIVPIGSGIYMLGEQGGSFDYSGSKIKVRLYQQAQQFCAQKGGDVEPVNSTGQDAGWEYASAEIHFRCTTKAAQTQSN